MARLSIACKRHFDEFQEMNKNEQDKLILDADSQYNRALQSIAAYIKKHHDADLHTMNEIIELVYENVIDEAIIIHSQEPRNAIPVCKRHMAKLLDIIVNSKQVYSIENIKSFLRLRATKNVFQIESPDMMPLLRYLVKYQRVKLKEKKT